VVPTVEEEWDGVIPMCGSDGRVDSVVLGCFDVEEERVPGVEEERAGVEAHAEDAEEGTRWRRTQRMRRRSGHRWLCGEEMPGLGFRGSAHLKRRIVVMGGLIMLARPSVNKNSSNGHDDIINARRYWWILTNTHRY
jgi:hypothetical protein